MRPVQPWLSQSDLATGFQPAKLLFSCVMRRGAVSKCPPSGAAPLTVRYFAPFSPPGEARLGTPRLNPFGCGVALTDRHTDWLPVSLKRYSQRAGARLLTAPLS
jgi:hypothetical protein